MRALVKTKPAPGLELLDVPKPEAGSGQVIVRVMATSLCGTDNHIYRWDEWAQGCIHPPRIIGHELCGEVVEVGPNVSAAHTREQLTQAVAAFEKVGRELGVIK